MPDKPAKGKPPSKKAYSGPKSYKGKTANILDITTRQLYQTHYGHATQIGAIAVQWSKIEALLAYLYALLVFGKRKTTDVGEWIAIEAFESATSIGTKRKLLLSATELRIGTEIKEKLRKVLKIHLQDCYDKRNDVVHGRWAINPDEPHELVRRPSVASLEKPLVWDTEDFQSVLDRMYRTYNAISKFFVEEIFPRIEPTDFTELYKQLFAAQEQK